MKFIYLFILLFAGLSTLYAQDEDLKYIDTVYMDYIKTVKLHRNDNVLSPPIVQLNSGEQIVLNFDDMEGEAKDFVYTIVHCDANWKPSTEIEEFDYIDGFTDELVTEYGFSTYPYVSYVHYNLTLPNENLSWTISGNYILKIYEDEDEKKLAITRRFMVVESLMQISAELVRASDVSKIRTHHEIDFSVNPKDIRIKNADDELYVYVMQNHRWDSAIEGLTPVFQRKNEYIYDYQDKVVFPAGKEFRWLDLRTVKYQSPRVEHIERFHDGYVVTAELDEKRTFKTTFHIQDINGDYVIQSLDRTNDRERVNIRDVFRQQRRAQYEAEKHSVESDYLDVWFSLDVPVPVYDADVYVFGGLSEWQLKEKFKMNYNQDHRMYETKVELKQGFYNYAYAVVQKGSTIPDLEEMEGDWHETDNDYTILVYYRPVSSRYDKLVAVREFNSFIDK